MAIDISSDGRVLYIENGTTESICSYEWDDIDASVLCRNLGLGMWGRAKYLSRDWSYDRRGLYGVFCTGNETDIFDCHFNEKDTTLGMCYQMDDAAVDCYTNSMPMTQFWSRSNIYIVKLEIKKRNIKLLQTQTPTYIEKRTI